MADCLALQLRLVLLLKLEKQVLLKICSSKTSQEFCKNVVIFTHYMLIGNILAILNLESYQFHLLGFLQKHLRQSAHFYQKQDAKKA